MDGKKTERIYYIEVLRAMAAFAVVALHVATNNWYGFIGSTDWIVFTVYGGLMKFCVPVFFMISGALFLEKSRHVSGKRLFCHNILRLVIFLVLWSFVYQMYHLAVRGEGGDLSAPAMVLQAVKNIIKGDTQVHFWFLYTMIALYLALPPVKVFTDHAEKKHLEYFLILWFVLRCVAPALSGIPVLQYAYVNAAKLGVTMTGGYLGYFILGHYLHSYPPEGIKRKAVYALGVVGVLTSIVITCVVCVRENACIENWFGYFFPGIAFWSAAVFLASRASDFVNGQILYVDGGILAYIGRQP